MRRCAPGMQQRGVEAALRSGAASSGSSEAGGAHGDEGGENGESAGARSSPASKPRTTALQACRGRWPWRGGGVELGSRMPPLPLLLSFFPNSSLARRRLAAHAAKRSRKRRESGQSICRTRMRHSLLHLDQRAQREVEEEPRPPSRRLSPSTHLTAAILSMSWRIREVHL
ncbi:hypothetical protein VPH35_041777 [Triticum aestivum]